MKMSNKRIIEYDAASEARNDDNLLMDSPAVGNRKITATNLIKPAMDAVSNEETERQNGDTNLDGKKYGNFVSTTDVTIDGVTYKTFWAIAPTSSNQVYGIANHPTNGKLYKIYNNNGTFTAEPYDLNATKGDEISVKAGQTGTIQTGIVSTVAADTSLDNAIGTLLNNDVTQDKQISDIKSDLNSMFIVKKQNFNNVAFPSQSQAGCWYSAAQTLSNPTGYTAVMVNLESGWGSCNGCLSPYIYHNQNKVGFMKNTSGQVGNITVEVLYIDNDYITWQT